jgi:hypothetical protein
MIESYKTLLDRSWVEAATKDIVYITVHKLYDHIKYKDSRVFLREDGCVDLTDELLDELTAIIMNKVDKTEYNGSGVVAVETVFEYFNVDMSLETKETVEAAIMAKFISTWMESIDKINETRNKNSKWS